MTGKERMLKTLRFEEPDRPPHFEVMFELEQEAFGLQFPDRRLWEGCSAAEKERMIDACMEVYANRRALPVGRLGGLLAVERPRRRCRREKDVWRDDSHRQHRRRHDVVDRTHARLDAVRR